MSWVCGWLRLECSTKHKAGKCKTMQYNCPFIRRSNGTDTFFLRSSVLVNIVSCVTDIFVSIILGAFWERVYQSDFFLQPLYELMINWNSSTFVAWAVLKINNSKLAVKCVLKHRTFLLGMQCTIAHKVTVTICLKIESVWKEKYKSHKKCRVYMMYKPLWSGHDKSQKSK